MTVNEEPEVHQHTYNDCYLVLSGFDNGQEGKEHTETQQSSRSPMKKVGQRTIPNCHIAEQYPSSRSPSSCREQVPMQAHLWQ